MERIAREQQRCPPGVHRVVSPKRYASEDSEGRPAAILSYQFQSRVNRMFPHALTEAGLCAICSSSGRGIVWCPSGPVSCTSCGHEYSNPSEQGFSISLDNSDVPSGLLVPSEKSSDDASDECCEKIASAGERDALARGNSASGGNAPLSRDSSDHHEECGCRACSEFSVRETSGTLRFSVMEFVYPVPASECDALACRSPVSGGNAPACEPASGSNAPACENPCRTSGTHRHRKRSPFCGSGAVGGVDFDGSPLSETDEEEYNEKRASENVTEYCEIRGHEDIPIEHGVADRSELPPGYRFAPSLSREELRARYQFRGQWIRVDTVDAAGAYINMNPDADLLMERSREYFMNITNSEWRRANLTQSLPTDTSGGEEEVDVPTKLDQKLGLMAIQCGPLTRLVRFNSDP